MARQLTTKAQVNGYRFILKRAEHALIRRDVRMLHDPMRSNLQALLIGGVIGLLLLGGCGIWGLIRPHGTVGDAKILTSRDDGGMYVLVGDTVHPVLNLPSARLIIGEAEKPKAISAKALAEYPRGPLLGIPGAPVSLPGPRAGGTSQWTICDTTGDRAASGTGVGGVQLSVIGGAPAGGPTELGEGEAALVATEDGTYLIYETGSPEARRPVRALVDMDSTPVRRALGVESVTPRLVSLGLLNSISEVDPIVVPRIAERGRQLPYPLPGAREGSVLRVDDIDGQPGYFVALADGVQRVGAVTAEILQLADTDSRAPLVSAEPGAVSALPVSDRLAVVQYPQRRPTLLDPVGAPTLCRTWERSSGDPRARMSLLAGRGLPVPPEARAVVIPSADGSGPAVDEVFLPPGSGEFVQVTGDEELSSRAESLFYITDFGVRHGIPDAQTAGVLGLDGTPAATPWSVVSLLPAGATLSQAAALVAHDGIANDGISNDGISNEGDAADPPRSGEVSSGGEVSRPREPRDGAPPG